MSLYTTLRGLKGLALGKPGSVDVSNFTFKLHRFTAVILITCSVLVTLKQYIGENIHCDISGIDEADGGAKLAESYCFMKATFTIPPENGKYNKHMAAHLGVVQGEGNDHPKNVFHNYYQWVCFVLFLQAVFFYAPYMVWKWVEKGRLGKLLAKVRSEPVTEKPAAEQVTGIARYLAENAGSYGWYAEKFLFCEAANLVNVVAQIYFTDKFLGGHFFLFGKSYLSEKRDDYEANLSSVVLETVFPKVTKCTLKLFGQTGKIVNHSGICTLPINILNEKIYLFLWFWFVGLAILSLFHFIWVLAVRIIRPLRFKLLSSICPTSQSVVQKISSRMSYGDFILLVYISKNLEPSQFKAVLVGLGEKLSEIYGEVYDSTMLPLFLNKEQINKSC